MSEQQKEKMDYAKEMRDFETNFPTRDELQLVKNITDLIWASNKIDKEKCPDKSTLALYIMKAQELNIKPLYGLAKLYLTPNGKFECQAELAMSLALRKYPNFIKGFALSDEIAELQVQKGELKAFFSYKIKELQGHAPFAKDWQTHPQDWLKARVQKRAILSVCPEVLSGMVLNEEKDAEDEIREFDNQLARKTESKEQINQAEEKLIEKPKSQPDPEEIAKKINERRTKRPSHEEIVSTGEEKHGETETKNV